MTPRRRAVRARDGLRLSALDWPGAEERTPLLCLPGIARNALDFVSVAARHAGTRRVVALDYAGHGASERPADPARYSVDIAIRDLLDAMAALHLHRVVLLGTSFGAMMAMALGIMRPCCLAAVAMNDAGPRLEPVGLDFVREVIGQDPAFPSLEAAVAFLRRRLPPLGLREEDWPGLAESTYVQGEDGHWHPRWDPRIVRVMDGGADGPAPNLWPAFRALDHLPLLLFWGQESAVLSADTVTRMRRERPDMAVVSLPGIGHAPSLREPASVAALDAFLDRVP